MKSFIPLALLALCAVRFTPVRAQDAAPEWVAIPGTSSRDGSLALAIAVEGKPLTNELIETLEPETEGLVNYIVNLDEGSILGETQGKYWSDRANMGNYGTDVVWSEGDALVAQTNQERFGSSDSFLYSLIDGKLSAPADLLALGTEAAMKALAESPQITTHGAEAFTIRIHDVRIVSAGGQQLVQFGVGGEIPKSELDDSYFDTTVTFALGYDEDGETSGAPKLEWVSTEVHE
jgi:hypothetical protein